MSLTGRFNFRETWLTGLALEVEEEVKPRFGGADKLKRRWRRARLTDLERPEMRELAELRFRLQFIVRTPRAAASAPAVSPETGAELPGPPAPVPAPALSPQRVNH